ncbi:hypothetical protein [Kribbella sp. NPDC048915]|uniref:hypothetical protein n=1 Tax=Kribbella sp. NPDC048915 TaxID=3155148 RepID=UPI0033C171CB
MRQLAQRLTPTALTAAAVAGVVTFSLVASAPVGNAAARPSSAYAVSAEGQLPLPKTPYAESPDGKRRTTSALELPENPLISVRAGTATAGNDSASVELFDIVVGPDILGQVTLPPELKQQCATLPSTGADDLPLPDIALPDLGLPLPQLSTNDLPVKNLPDLCNLLLNPPKSLLAIDALNVWCSGDEGGIDIGALTLLGQTIKAPTTKEGATLPAAPLATITVNSQTKHSDGAFTITGLSINLGGGAQVIKLASATCATPAAPKPQPQPQPQPANDAPAQLETPPTAPVPTPVKTHHPVTG